MDLSCIPDAVWVERGPAMFRVIVGGDSVWLIIVDHWRGMSDREIQDKHGVPKTTARRWIRQAMVNMRRAGLNADAVRGYAEIAKAGV